jgi:hypothetical protein
MLIAQITDTHITPRGTIAHGRDAFAAFEQALAAVVSTDPRPDFILHTGDVTHHGDAALNREVRAALDATGIPYAVIPGNHDETEPLREAFADKPWMPKSGFIQFVIDASTPRFPARLPVRCATNVSPGWKHNWKPAARGRRCWRCIIPRFASVGLRAMRNRFATPKGSPHWWRSIRTCR